MSCTGEPTRGRDSNVHLRATTRFRPSASPPRRDVAKRSLSTSLLKGSTTRERALCASRMPRRLCRPNVRLCKQPKLHVAVGDEYAYLTVYDELGDPRDGRGDDREPGRHPVVRPGRFHRAGLRSELALRTGRRGGGSVRQHVCRGAPRPLGTTRAVRAGWRLRAHALAARRANGPGVLCRRPPSGGDAPRVRPSDA